MGYVQCPSLDVIAYLESTIFGRKYFLSIKSLL